MYDVAVIGGGISGLVAGYELSKRGHKTIVLEQSPWPGGNAVSERFDGFLMEHGPCTVSAMRPAPRKLAEELGMDNAICTLGSGIKRRYLTKNDRLASMGTRPQDIFLSGYLSPWARMRLLMEPFIRPCRQTSEETVGDFSRRRFGQEFTKKIADPFLSGLYAGDIERSSMIDLFPQLVGLEQQFGSVLRGMIARSRVKKPQQGGKLYSWHQGVATLPKTLANRLGARGIRTGFEVTGISRVKTGFRIASKQAGALTCRAVVIATPPHAAAALLEEIARDRCEAVASIAAPPIAVVFMGFRRDEIAHPLDGIGYLTPSHAGRAVTGVHFNSTMFPARAPEGYVALTAYIGGAHAPSLENLSATVLTELALEEFRDLLGVTSPPVVSRVRCWRKGIPEYRIGHQDILSEIDNIAEETPGLFVTGKYLRGPAIGACVETAQTIAARAHQHLSALAT